MPLTQEQVDHPRHYTQTSVECIDIIEELGLGFHLGCCLKYIWRAGLKDESEYLTDLRKARWYLDRKIMLLEREEDGRSQKVDNAERPELQELPC